MGGNLVTFLAILGLASASVKTTGTLKNINVVWTAKDTTDIFKLITIWRNDVKIIETDKTVTNTIPNKLTYTCTVSPTNVECKLTVLDPNEKAIYEVYKATVNWNAAGNTENHQDSDIKYVTKDAAIDKRVATKPDIKMTQNAILKCSSTGVPPPTLAWKTTGEEPKDVPELKHGFDLDSAAQAFKSWSTYNATSDKYASITCTADGVKSEIFKIFLKASKPTIKETKAGNKTILNCTSEGIPAPTLSWIDGTKDGKELKQVYASDIYWNSTSFVSRSTILPGSQNMNLTCTAQQEGDAVKVTSDVFTYSVNSAGKYGGPGALIVALWLLRFSHSLIIYRVTE